MFNLLFDGKNENGNHHQYNNLLHHQHPRFSSYHSLLLSLPNDACDDVIIDGKESKGYNNNNNNKIDEKSPLLLNNNKSKNILPPLNPTIPSPTLPYQVRFYEEKKVDNHENIRFVFYVLFYCFYLVAGGLLFCTTESPIEMSIRRQLANSKGAFMAKYPSVTGNIILYCKSNIFHVIVRVK